MTIEVHSLGRMRVYEEVTASFAADHTGTLGDFLDVPFQETTAQLKLIRNQLDSKNAQQFIDGWPSGYLGTKSAELTFSMVLHPPGVAADASTATIGQSASALMRLLKVIMGGVQSGQQGSLATGTPTSSSIIVTGSEGTQFEAGGAIGWSNGTNVEMREVEAISTDTLTLKHALSTAPVATNIIYNTSTAYLTENPDTSLQMIVEGVEVDDRWVLLGGQGGFTLSFPIGELPVATFNLKFANFLNVADCAGSGTLNAAIAAATYSNFSPTHVVGEFLAQVVATATRNIVQVSSIAFNPTIAYVPVTSPSGTQTVARWRRNRTAPICQVQFTSVYEDETTWFDVRDARTDYHFALQCGTAAGSSLLITTPTAQIVDVQRLDDGGLAAQQITANARLDTDCTSSGSAELTRSAFRIHFG